MSSADDLMQHAGNLMIEGRLDEARAVLQNALAVEPDNPDAHHALAVLLLHRQSMEDAVTHFERAITLDPDFADAHHQLGIAYFMQARPSDAIRSLQRAVGLDPELSAAHLQLGELLQTEGRLGDAVTAFRSAAMAKPVSATGQLAEAKALLIEERLPEAEALLRAALGQEPTNQAATAALGLLLHETGRFAEAGAHYARMIAAQPNNADAWYGLSLTRRFSASDRPLVQRMATALSEPLAPRARMTLHFAVGKIDDDLGDPASAMRHFDAANDIRRTLVPYDHVSAEATFERWMQATPVASPGADEPSDEGMPAPVFILGLPRSGTTLVEQILSSHPAVAAGGERAFWQTAGAEWDRAGCPPLADANRQALRNAYLTLLRGVAAREKPGASLVTDKNPYNFQRVGLIHAVLPHARIVHCRRDARDVCLSLYTTNLATVQGFMSNRSDLVRYVRLYERLMRHWRALLPPDRFLEVGYENLVAEPEAASRELLAFCGLPWDPACARPEANARAVRTASLWQSRQPIYRSSVARWRRYEPWLGALADLG